MAIQAGISYGYGFLGGQHFDMPFELLRTEISIDMSREGLQHVVIVESVSMMPYVSIRSFPSNDAKGCVEQT